MSLISIAIIATGIFFVATEASAEANENFADSGAIDLAEPIYHEKYYPHAHTGFLVDNYEDLPTEKGEVIQHRDGTVGVYVKDPFGNYLEYIWYSDEQKEVFLDD